GQRDREPAAERGDRLRDRAHVRRRGALGGPYPLRHPRHGAEPEEGAGDPPRRPCRDGAGARGRRHQLRRAVRGRRGPQRVLRTVTAFIRQGGRTLRSLWRDDPAQAVHEPFQLLLSALPESALPTGAGIAVKRRGMSVTGAGRTVSRRNAAVVATPVGRWTERHAISISIVVAIALFLYDAMNLAAQHVGLGVLSMPQLIVALVLSALLCAAYVLRSRWPRITPLLTYVGAWGYAALGVGLSP